MNACRYTPSCFCRSQFCQWCSWRSWWYDSVLRPYNPPVVEIPVVIERPVYVYLEKPAPAGPTPAKKRELDW
jgi:hypothetical protein